MNIFLNMSNMYFYQLLVVDLDFRYCLKNIYIKLIFLIKRLKNSLNNIKLITIYFT